MTLKKRFLGGNPVLISVIFVFHALYHVEQNHIKVPLVHDIPTQEEADCQPS